MNSNPPKCSLYSNSLSEEDPLSGNSKADPTMAVFIPAEVGDRRPRVLSVSSLWHMCNRLCEHADEQQGSACHSFLTFSTVGHEKNITRQYLKKWTAHSVNPIKYKLSAKSVCFWVSSI